MCHWFFPDTPVRVSSFGGLQHFRKSGKPAEAGDATRCLDCAYETQCRTARRGVSFLSPLTRPLVDHIRSMRRFNIRQFIWTGLPWVELAGRFVPSSTESRISRTSRKRSSMDLTGNACMRATTTSATTRCVRRVSDSDRTILYPH